MDNSKRITYGLDAQTQYLTSSISQTYEFTSNSNFHKEQGNDNKLRLIGSLKYLNKNELTYNFRYDVDDLYLKQQKVGLNSKTNIGDVNLSYLDKNTETNDIVTRCRDNKLFFGKKFSKFSKLNFNGLYDLKKEINKEYSIGYSYFDECFGINIDFNRKSYEEDNLKPQDILTLMFSFKNIGSYKSTNLAVSENDKQDINWEDII